MEEQDRNGSGTYSFSPVVSLCRRGSTHNQPRRHDERNWSLRACSRPFSLCASASLRETFPVLPTNKFLPTRFRPWSFVPGSWSSRLPCPSHPTPCFLPVIFQRIMTYVAATCRLGKKPGDFAEWRWHLRQTPRNSRVFIRLASVDIRQFPAPPLFLAAFSATITGFPVGLKVGHVGRLACGIPPFSFGRRATRHSMVH